MFADRNARRAEETDDLEYELARLPRDVTAAITWYMTQRDISQAQLAALMKVTPGRVSQILSGDENLTLRSLAAVCVALKAHFEVDLVPNTRGNVPEPRPSRPSVPLSPRRSD